MEGLTKMRPERLLPMVVLASSIVAACGSAGTGQALAPTPSPSSSAGPASPAQTSPAQPSAESSVAANSPAASIGPDAVRISVLNERYEQTAVIAPAGKPFQIAFENKDFSPRHNVAIRAGDAAGPEVFKGELFFGQATRIYDVPALVAGSYVFECSIHYKTMTGTIEVK
jgi:plastocyanin